MNGVVLLQVHVVFAFEQSLVNMTQRLQRLAATTDQKVSKFVKHSVAVEQ